MDAESYAMIGGYFYNVNENEGLTGDVYDDFFAQLIDTAKWTSTEFVRECSKGYLRSNIRGIGSNRQNSTALIERDTAYIEAKVRIDNDSQLSFTDRIKQQRNTN